MNTKYYSQILRFISWMIFESVQSSPIHYITVAPCSRKQSYSNCHSCKALFCMITQLPLLKCFQRLWQRKRGWDRNRKLSPPWHYVSTSQRQSHRMLHSGCKCMHNTAHHTTVTMIHSKACWSKVLIIVK